MYFYKTSYTFFCGTANHICVAPARHILVLPEAVNYHALATDATVGVAGLVLEQRYATYAGESLLAPSPQ